MAALEQDTSLAANLRRIQVLTRDWPGQVLDEEGTVRLVHPAGTGTRMVWCFNDATEFPRLAEALGPDRPMVGLRSLHNVIDASLANSVAADALADHYADTLIRRFGKAPLVIGGVCQGALIAYRLALRLQAASARVLQLITLEAELHYPFPGRMRLLFGRNSSEYNPFLARPPDPAHPAIRSWSYAFGETQWGLVEGAHIDLFQPSNARSLASAIAARRGPRHRLPRGLSEPAPGRGGWGRVLTDRVVSPLRLACRRRLLQLDWQVVEQSEEALTLRANGPKLPGDFAILPVWRRPEGGYHTIPAPHWISPVFRGEGWTCRVQRPVLDGPWHMWPVLCERGNGPVIWPIERSQKFEFD